MMDEKLDRIIELLGAQVAATQALVETNQALLAALAEEEGADPEPVIIQYMDGGVREVEADQGAPRYMDGSLINV